MNDCNSEDLAQPVRERRLAGASWAYDEDFLHHFRSTTAGEC
jgi:hypothetical protein